MLYAFDSCPVCDGPLAYGLCTDSECDYSDPAYDDGLDGIPPFEDDAIILPTDYDDIPAYTPVRLYGLLRSLRNCCKKQRQ